MAAPRRHVLGPESMPVARVAPGVAQRLERFERAAQRVAADTESSLQLHEARAAALVEEGERRWCPAMVKEVDQVGR
jgi:hypothetical protein